MRALRVLPSQTLPSRAGRAPTRRARLAPLLLVVAACQAAACGRPAAPAPAVALPPAVEVSQPHVAVAAPTAERPATEASAPLPEASQPAADAGRATLNVAGRTISLAVAKEPGGASSAVRATVTAPDVPPLVLELEPEGDCERVVVALDAVGAPTSPLVLAQSFCEQGEDEFSRGIHAYVLHVGGATSSAHVLWKGTGTFSSSFGVCDHIDVPVARVVGSNTLLVEQWTEVVARPNPANLGGGGCVAKAPLRRKLLETSF